MASAFEPIPLASLGLDAASVLRAGARGTVAAVFDRSLYARFHAEWICFGDTSIGNGPLNALVPDRTFAGWLEGVAMADAVEVAGCGAGSAVAWRVRPHGARIWQAPTPGPPSPRRVRARLAELPRRLPAGMPEEGLACFIRRPACPSSPVARAAQPHVRVVAAWIATSDGRTARELLEALGGLIGLGPGLTPSGDDFLAGVLATLHSLGRRNEADALWREIEPLAPGRTHAISISHLRAAARGGLCEALHGQIGALLGHGDWPTLDCWPRLGHSSPWDALAGVAMTLRASLTASERSDKA